MRKICLCLAALLLSVSLCSAQFGLTKAFPLLEPSNGALITLQGSRTTTMQFKWNKGTTGLATASTYKWMLDTVGADFLSPAVLICSCNSTPAFDTVLTMTYDDLANHASAVKPFNTGDTIELEWQVYLEANDAAPIMRTVMLLPLSALSW